VAHDQNPVAILPRGFPFGLGETDHHLLQIAYNLDHSELVENRDSVPSARAPNWVCSATGSRSAAGPDRGIWGRRHSRTYTPRTPLRLSGFVTRYREPPGGPLCDRGARVPQPTPPVDLTTR